MGKATYAALFGLLLAGSAFGQQTYRVREGESLSVIAEKLGVSTRALSQANGITDPLRVRAGKILRVPARSAAPRTASAPARTSGGGYSVREGDTDWDIARKLGVTVGALHRANPGVRWTRLQIGQRINLPNSTTTSSATARVASRPTATGSYTVRSGDNDWLIARRFGTTPSAIRAANPGVRWTNLQIGTRLVIPGQAASARVASAPSSNRIRTRYAKISRDDVNIRRRASTGSAVITQVDAGTRVTVLDRDGDWYQLRFPRGTVGWVRSDMLTPVSSREVSRTVQRNSNRVAARPSSSNRSTSRRGGRPEPSIVTGDVTSVVQKALSMRGVRYRFGGMSRSGTDCSGFTSQVFRAHGVRLPRTSREQANTGRAVSRSGLKQGDLVFFRTNRSRRINHVGIYIGNGQFVHASSGGRQVRVDNLNDGYYDRRFAGARRVKNVSTPKVASQSRPKPAAPAPAAAPKPETSPNPAVEAEDAPSTPATGTDEIIR